MFGQFVNVAGYSSMPAGFFALLALLSIWSLAWKGFALWRAAKNDSKPWFIALLIVNTAGILEILYLFVFGKKKEGQNNPQI